mmetsp:Transcript_34100/g.69635  ORF Transcript_34100/g.69635 Transcript_34100/m.69635 type:complete len:133 (+) Transcript_34100:3933-4331(+)
MEYCRNRKEIPIPKRGKFHCAHKMDNGECCTYSAAFSFMKQRDGFMILDGRRPDGAEESGYSTNFCLEQSHPVEGVCVGADDCFSVSKHDDLKLEVVEFICTLAGALHNTSKGWFEAQVWEGEETGFLIGVD